MEKGQELITCFWWLTTLLVNRETETQSLSLLTPGLGVVSSASIDIPNVITSYLPILLQKSFQLNKLKGLLQLDLV